MLLSGYLWPAIVTEISPDASSGLRISPTMPSVMKKIVNESFVVLQVSASWIKFRGAFFIDRSKLPKGLEGIKIKA